MLKMKFVGAIEGVSGSCTWLHHTESNTQFLVDCGMHQGNERDEWANRQAFPFQAERLKYVLLTHAHIDHCGLLPRLVREGFSGLVYATRATRELTEVMLLDAARVSESFTELEVKAIQWSVLDEDPGFKWGRLITLAEGVWMTYLRSSHILGACLISIGWEAEGTKKTICFSGDVGCQSDDNPYLPLMKSGQHPFAKTDYIVVESTYGGRIRAAEHQCSDSRLQRLGEVISHTLFSKGGKVLLPAFSLHRTQELMMDVLQWMKGLPESEYSASLNNYDENHPLTCTVHAPLGRAVTEVYSKHLCSLSPNGKFKYLNKALVDSLCMSAEAIQAMLKHLVSNGEYPVGDDRLMAMLKPKCASGFASDVVIASAGMCDHGPVVSYLDKWEMDPRNTVIVTGYQSKGSHGAELMARATSVCAKGSEMASGKAEVIDMSSFYSAHADQKMLLDFIFTTDGYGNDMPATVFINHGNRGSKHTLREVITERAAKNLRGDRKVAEVRIADARWVNLNTGEPIEENPAEQEMRAELARLREQLSVQQELS